MDRVTLQNSPFWTSHYIYSNDIRITNVTVLAPATQGNTDGFNPDSSSNVRSTLHVPPSPRAPLRLPKLANTYCWGSSATPLDAQTMISSSISLRCWPFTSFRADTCNDAVSPSPVITCFHLRCLSRTASLATGMTASQSSQGSMKLELRTGNHPRTFTSRMSPPTAVAALRWGRR